MKLCNLSETTAQIVSVFKRKCVPSLRKPSGRYILGDKGGKKDKDKMAKQKERTHEEKDKKKKEKQSKGSA